MEDREENSHGTEIPKKSRSLDLKSLYKSKVTKETPNKGLKRKGSHPRGVDEDRIKKKKTRKEVSLSSLENADVSIKKVADEEYQKGLGSGRQDLCEQKQGLSGSTGLNRGSLSFDGNVHIPKRRRDFVGRNKFEVGPAQKLAGQPSSTSSHGDQMPKLTSDDLDKKIDSSKIKLKRDFDQFKESRSNSAVNSGDSSLKKSRKKDRKQKALAPYRNIVAKEDKPLIDGSKISDYLREDEEENLEENAARMLSSRFDPNYAGFCSSSKPSTLPSSNGLSFLLSSSRNIDSCGSKSQSGSESASVDTAGRVLRPRKQYKEKGSSRKRRHFYEISLGDLDEHWILNQRIKVFWPLDQIWYHGLVDGYNNETRCHHIKYDDREEEWINLQSERFKLLLLPSEVPGKAGKKRAARKNRSLVQQKESLSSKDRQVRDAITEEDSCGESCMDTEPIISWLSRSSLRFKSSAFHGTKKKKTSVTLPSTSSSLLCDVPVKVQRCLAESSPREGKSNLSRDSVSEDNLGDKSWKKSPLQSFSCPKDVKQPIVYFRRRFRKPTPILPHISEDKHDNTTASCSTSIDPVVAAFKFDLKYPIKLVLNDSFNSENLWLFRAILLLHYGTVMTLWPRVHLEMLFVDNVVGLRFLLFEGCLMMAAAFVFCVLRLFHQPVDQEMYIDLQLPVTSIRFRFSSVYGIKNPLVFAFYNFSRVKNSKWMYLDSKLKSHCLLSKQLHLSECTYDNIQALQNQSSPPLWERYQHELREWEVAMTKNNIPISNGCLDKVLTLEKPAMFAFCLKPRGLEVLNKGSKHRSQKKISVSGHSNSILYEQDGFHPYGRRYGLAYGDEKFAYSGHNYDYVDDSPLPQTSPIFSPRDACSMGYYSINNSYDRNHIPKYNRHKWNVGYYDMAGHRQYLLDGSTRHGIEQIDHPDLDELRKRDASGAAQHAANMAKLKRERAQRLLYRADLAIHKAVVALMTAEAMKASEDSNGDG
uniref:Histone-lysine N-methyltransferase ATX2 n=1 Tax=Cajanus cajan TaxID=3821 RepID=A0A151SQT4_CAJCA|nr:Histone-lysine N-methyltransferase ATX2 [Cajanus cajan]